MCSACFQREYRRFELEAEYERFVLRFRSQPAVRFVCRKEDAWAKPRFVLFGIVEIGKKGEDEYGYDLLHCGTCGQCWELNHPGLYWRGLLRRCSERSLSGCP
ncbi:MAG: hypothetical protein AAF089_14810 [Bacteroidota bacterium]